MLGANPPNGGMQYKSLLVHLIPCQPPSSRGTPPRLVYLITGIPLLQLNPCALPLPVVRPVPLDRHAHLRARVCGSARLGSC